jgi:hypothetical protein
MVRFDTQQRAPHLLVELGGTVTGSDVRTELADLPQALRSLPDDFVALIVYPDATYFKANAVGPLFYFVTHLFDADPGLCVFVDGGRSPHPGLRAFIGEIELENQTAFVPTRTEADERIHTHLQTTN